MRIGLVYAHSGAPDGCGGSATGTRRHILRLATELSRLRHEVRVYQRRQDPGEPATSVVDGYLVVRVPAGPPAPAPTAELLAHVPAFGQWLAEHWSSEWAPDVVHGHFWLGGLAAASAAGRAGVPVVQTFHSIATEQRRQLGPEYAGPGIRIVLERALSRAVDLAVAQCVGEVDELARMGRERASVVVVPAGVDTERFTPEGESAPREQRRRRILAVGGLTPAYGHEDLIRGLRLIGDAELVIAGGPPRRALSGHAEARRLRELARQVGVDEQLMLIGAVEHAQMPRLYRSADVVACAARYAPAGTVPLEAMACGVPVVGYAHGGVADSVVDSVTGRLVPTGDLRGLGVTVRRLLADEAERFAYGHAAVDRVRCRYGWDRTAAALDRLYQRVLDAPRVLSPTRRAESARAA